MLALGLRAMAPTYTPRSERASSVGRLDAWAGSGRSACRCLRARASQAPLDRFFPGPRGPAGRRQRSAALPEVARPGAWMDGRRRISARRCLGRRIVGLGFTAGMLEHALERPTPTRPRRNRASSRPHSIEGNHKCLPSPTRSGVSVHPSHARAARRHASRSDTPSSRARERIASSSSAGPITSSRASVFPSFGRPPACFVALRVVISGARHVASPRQRAKRASLASRARGQPPPLLPRPLRVPAMSLERESQQLRHRFVPAETHFGRRLVDAGHELGGTPVGDGLGRRLRWLLPRLENWAH